MGLKIEFKPYSEITDQKIPFLVEHNTTSHIGIVGESRHDNEEQEILWITGPHAGLTGWFAEGDFISFLGKITLQNDD